MKPRRRRSGRSTSALPRALAAAAALLTLPGAAAASHLDGFVFTFEPGTAEDIQYWCTNLPPGNMCFAAGDPVTDFGSSSWSGSYLGPFTTESVWLAGMDYLESWALFTRRAYLSFDLILTGVWGGSGPFTGFESFFAVVANDQTLLDATFAFEDVFIQSYPGSYPQDTYPAGTGSELAQPNPPLGVWHFDLNFMLTPFLPTCCTDVRIEFSARFGPGYSEIENDQFTPRWGLDHVVVSSTPIPEPASAALVGLGLLALGRLRRR